MAGDKPVSQIQRILLTIGKKIHENPIFKTTPIFFDDSIVTPNTIHYPCIIFNVNAWKPTGEFCEYERILEIRIIDQSEDKDDILRRLWLFEEELRKTLEQASLDTDFTDFTLQIYGGSPPAILTYAKKDKESYKSTGTLNASAIIVYYRLRYEIL